MRRPYYRRNSPPKNHDHLLIRLWNFLSRVFDSVFPKKEKQKHGQIVPFFSEPLSNIEFLPALFSSYPELIGRLPWVSLRGCESPSTPKKVSRAQHYFGNNHIFIKRESRDADLISESQAKKLEFVLGDILQQNPDEIIYFGEVEDAWNLALAQACSIIKMPLRMYLLDAEKTAEEDFDLVGIRSLGVNLRILESETQINRYKRWQKMRARFKKIVILPDEMKLPVAVLGYAGALFEIKTAVERAELPLPQIVFVPVDTGVSFAGLEISRRLCGFSQMTLIGIVNDESRVSSAQELVDLMSGAASLLTPHLQGLDLGAFSDKDFQILEVKPEESQLPHLVRWSSRFMELEGVELETEFSAPALKKMVEVVEDKAWDSKVLLFWNSYSGQRNFDLGGREFLEVKESVRRKKFVRRSS
jgi:1-aminocyclopropane-1-carboxylate deaminase/D-cysteine desulfhydrase-like pyridoxal-dependent ACC family enzyme